MGIQRIYKYAGQGIGGGGAVIAIVLVLHATQGTHVHVQERGSTKLLDLHVSLFCITLIGLGCVLTTLLLMQALDAHTYADQITGKFKQLCSIDPYRTGYYSDLCKDAIMPLAMLYAPILFCHTVSKFIIEQTLKSLLQDISGCDRTLNLSKRVNPTSNNLE